MGAVRRQDAADMIDMGVARNQVVPLLPALARYRGNASACAILQSQDRNHRERQRWRTDHLGQRRCVTFAILATSSGGPR